MSDSPIDPEVALSHAARGKSLLAAGREAAALEAFERAAWLAPDEPRIHWALANVLWRLGRGEDAVPVYERVIELMPDEPAPRCNLAELLAVLGRVSDARVQIAAARGLSSDDPHLHFAEATVRLAQRRAAAAEESARQAVASDVLPKFAFMALGNALLAQGKDAEALRAYRRSREHCEPADLGAMRLELRWLGTVFPEMNSAAHQHALSIFAPQESGD